MTIRSEGKIGEGVVRLTGDDANKLVARLCKDGDDFFPFPGLPIPDAPAGACASLAYRHRRIFPPLGRAEMGKS